MVRHGCIIEQIFSELDLDNTPKTDTNNLLGLLEDFDITLIGIPEPPPSSVFIDNLASVTLKVLSR